MFKFLKEKLKGTIKKLSGRIDKEGVTEETKKEKVGESLKEELKKEQEEKTKEETKEKEEEKKKGFFSKIRAGFSRKEKEEKKEEKKKTDVEKTEEKKKKEEDEERKTESGFFRAIKEKVTTKKINKEKFEELFWDLELALLESNVAVEVIEKIKQDLIRELVDKPLLRSKIEETISNTLKRSIENILSIESFNLLEKINKKPYVICFFGINGSGKTTTIAKIAKLLKDNNLSVVLVAADTWRQAAIEQLEEWAKRLNVPIVKHSYGADPAAVAYDGIAMAKARNIDVVLIDTAGRMHTNINLIEEMKKIVRVAKPDLKIFVGEAITGNDCINQAKEFNESIGIDGVILSKVDVDEKGGAAVSVSYVTKKPIIYLGIGQDLNDLREFDSKFIVENLGLV